MVNIMGERKSFRTQPSVESGIIASDEQFCAVRVLDYQPGNGTRYAMSFIKLEHFVPHVLDRADFSNNTWLVTLHNIGHRKAITFSEKGSVRIERVAEQFGIGFNDAACLVELIAKVTHSYCDTAESLYDQGNRLHLQELAAKAKPVPPKDR